MAAFFLDTSALVKRYDRGEVGSARVRELCEPVAGHLLCISTLAGVEIASALRRKLREGRVSPAEQDDFWVAFQSDEQSQYRVVAWDGEIRLSAIDLLFAYVLRGYDAVQLATALRVKALLAPLAEELIFCSADREQARAASAEGLKVELIGAAT